MAKTRASVERKVLKQFEGLGDLEELKAIKTQLETKKFEEQKSKGDFDSILKEMASKKDAEIARRDAIIAQYRVDSPLVEAAAKHRAVAPEQVKALLRNNIRLTQDGEVEVVEPDIDRHPLHRRGEREHRRALARRQKRPRQRQHGHTDCDVRGHAALRRRRNTSPACKYRHALHRSRSAPSSRSRGIITPHVGHRT